MNFAVEDEDSYPGRQEGSLSGLKLGPCWMLIPG